MRGKTLLLIVWFCLVAMACNLSNPNSEPPTVQPRGFDPANDATAQATLGVNTSNAVGGGVIETPAPPSATVEQILYNLTNEVQPDRLYRHVEALVSFRTRHVNSSQTDPNEGIGAARRYIISELEAIQQQLSEPDRFTVEEHTFTAYTGDGKESQQSNIVGVLQGTEIGAGIIVIGAHYDSRTDDLLNASANAPGAADNGSGVAVVLEVARVLSQQPQRSTVIFVLFSAEEHNRQGSKAFVQDWVQFYNFDLIAMINVDTVGSWNDSQGNINDSEIRLFANGTNKGSLQLARTTNFISVNYDLALTIQYVDQIDREGRFGDHFSFDEANYPAIRFIEALEDNYNREGRDTIDKVEVSYMADSAKSILGIISALSGGPRPPGNIVFRDAGNGMRSLIWEPSTGADSYIVALRSPGSLVYNQQFTEPDTATAPWDQWANYDSLAIAAVDKNGVIGPLSPDIPIP